MKELKERLYLKDEKGRVRFWEIFIEKEKGDKNKDKKNKEYDKQAITPQLLFLSSGESSSVVLEIASEDGNKQQISVDDLSAVTLGTQVSTEQTK